ncbi:MAG: FAD-dependent oxidoreductase [Clostridiaceae bacterium]|jgi:glycine/D-amino acid oxidase-like deaminating enzyme/nitrite reductase/ring-hydroxylating ferredoxin subunit|nr:FAD-dependent oxidoreductase [Clostridiaceae bacterium]
MNTNQFKSFKNPPHSFWLASTDSDDYPQLSEDIKTEVAIIGGGMTGILCAYFLQKKGMNSVILEAGKIVSGTTAHTTAKITSQHGLIYNKIKNQRGLEFAKQYAEANESAITEFKKIIDENQIECDFTEQSAYIYTQSEEKIQKMQDELKTTEKLGIKASYAEEIPFPIPIKAAIRFDLQAQFHPRKFLLPIAKKISEANVRIYERTRAVDLEEGNEFTIITDQGKKVTAKKVIISSHYPFYNKAGMYFSRIYTERAYIIAIKANEKYPGGMYINAEEPSRSLRGYTYGNEELIFIVGENHKTGQGNDMVKHYHALINFASEIFTINDIPYRWSTQDCMTLDGVPYVGRYKTDTPDLYVATGFEKWGMTNSMASALILRDMILDIENPWQEVYNPSRQNISGAVKNFVVENADVAKHLVKGKISSLPENIDLKPGEAKVFKSNGERIGAFRDDSGKLHLVNTTCTHMGCELNWNSAENSWDCPCHGSRFTCSGSIIEGPAVEPLTDENDVNTIEKIIREEF